MSGLQRPPKPEDWASIPPLSSEELAAATDGLGASEDQSFQFDLDQALKENFDLSSGASEQELKDKAAKAEHDRNERFRDHFELLAIIGLWIAAFVLSGLGLVWIVHMVLPAQYRWLSSEDLAHIQSIITAGLLVGIIGNHFKKRLG